MTQNGGGKASISGRPIVVTGGASGLGRALALEAGARGARSIAILDVDGAGASETVDMLRAAGVSSASYLCDVSDLQAVHSVARTVIQDHGIPGLVCANAGVAVGFAPVLDEAQADIEWVFAVNVLGVVGTFQAFAKPMVASNESGWLLATGSEHAIGVPHIGMGSYTASKHAVLAYCDVLRAELPKHVGISVLCPSIVATQLWNAGRARPRRFGEASGTNPVARAIMSRGFEPAAIAREGLDGVSNGEFLIVTHRSTVGPALRRTRQIEASLERLTRPHADTAGE